MGTVERFKEQYDTGGVSPKALHSGGIGDVLLKTAETLGVKYPKAIENELDRLVNIECYLAPAAAHALAQATQAVVDAEQEQADADAVALSDLASKSTALDDFASVVEVDIHAEAEANLRKAERTNKAARKALLGQRSYLSGLVSKGTQKGAMLKVLDKEWTRLVGFVPTDSTTFKELAEHEGTLAAAAPLFRSISLLVDPPGTNGDRKRLYAAFKDPGEWLDEMPTTTRVVDRISAEAAMTEVETEEQKLAKARAKHAHAEDARAQAAYRRAEPYVPTEFDPVEYGLEPIETEEAA